MRSPFTIGNVLIIASLSVMLLPLMGPLISLCIHLIDDYFLVPSSLDVSSTKINESTSTMVLQLLWWILTMIMEFIFKSVSITLHALNITIALMPQLAAGGMIAYLGICLGYVGLVHLGCINPDKAMIRNNT